MAQFSSTAKVTKNFSTKTEAGLNGLKARNKRLDLLSLNFLKLSANRTHRDGCGAISHIFLSHSLVFKNFFSSQFSILSRLLSVSVQFVFRSSREWYGEKGKNRLEGPSIPCHLALQKSRPIVLTQIKRLSTSHFYLRSP